MSLPHTPTPGVLRTRYVPISGLVQLSKFPQTEPYWDQLAAYRFDDPLSAARFGITYAGLSNRVAICESAIHQSSCFAGRNFVVDEGGRTRYDSYGFPHSAEQTQAHFKA